MKRISAAIISLFWLTGCTPRGNVSDKAYLRGAAIDSGVVTFSFYSDEDVISAVSSDLDEAISKAEIGIGKEIFTGHTELVILGDCDKTAVLEHMLHSWKVSPSCRIWETNESGDEILRKNSIEKLTGIIDTEEEKGIIGKTDIVTALKNSLEPRSP